MACPSGTPGIDWRKRNPKVPQCASDARLAALADKPGCEQITTCTANDNDSDGNSKGFFDANGDPNVPVDGGGQFDVFVWDGVDWCVFDSGLAGMCLPVGTPVAVLNLTGTWVQGIASLAEIKPDSCTNIAVGKSTCFGLGGPGPIHVNEKGTEVDACETGCWAALTPDLENACLINTGYKVNGVCATTNAVGGTTCYSGTASPPGSGTCDGLGHCLTQ